MDLTLTETQTMLQNATREFMEAEMPKSRVLEIDDSESGFAADIWEKMCGQEWPGMVIPEEYGGVGLSFTDLGVIYEIMGFHACPSPHHSSAVLSAHTILEAGDSAQKQALLPSIASGQQIFTFAYTEPDYGWGPGVIQLQASRRDGSFVLNGTKLFIPDANVADQIIVAARTNNGGTPEQGISLFVVDKNSPGVSVRVQTGWIGPKVCEVNFENVEVAASNVLGAVDEAWTAIDKARDKATALICIYMAGGTQRVYEMARDYSQTRIATAQRDGGAHGAGDDNRNFADLAYLGFLRHIGNAGHLALCEKQVPHRCALARIATQAKQFAFLAHTVSEGNRDRRFDALHDSFWRFEAARAAGDFFSVFREKAGLDIGTLPLAYARPLFFMNFQIGDVHGGF